jgi:signal transduction histidine kinase/CheY-like chemotaxis protein
VRTTTAIAVHDSSLQAVTAIRRVIKNAAAEERVLLAARARQQEFDTWASLLIMAVGFIAAVTLVAWSNSSLLYALRAHEHAENEAIRAREQAEAASHSKSDFLARMSHELRTPLNSVIGFANVLLKNRDGRLAQSDITYLDRIQANGRHLLSLINQILDLSKIEAGRVELEIRPVNVGVLIHEIVAHFEPQARERLVDVLAVVPDRLQLVNTDAEKLRQILINLIGNALKFTERGTVAVIVTAKQGVVGSIAVRDTGIGIPPDRLSAVFDAFEQAETTTARRFGGTGLGLSISRSLAQLMGLELTVESILGEGTTFTLLFPSRAATLTPSRGAMLPRPDAHPTGADMDALRDRLVLVIDDDPDSRMLMAQYLEDLGCRVIAATNGEQGLRMANGFSPDAIILDLRMPGIDGWEVLRRLQADPALQTTPTIVVSVVARESREEVVGAVGLIDKPCTRDELAAGLGRVLQGKAAATSKG